MDSGIVNCNLNLQMVHLGKEYVSRNGPAQNVPFYHDFETQAKTKDFPFNDADLRVCE